MGQGEINAQVLPASDLGRRCCGSDSIAWGMSGGGGLACGATGDSSGVANQTSKHTSATRPRDTTTSLDTAGTPPVPRSTRRSSKSFSSGVVSLCRRKSRKRPRERSRPGGQGVSRLGRRIRGRSRRTTCTSGRDGSLRLASPEKKTHKLSRAGLNPSRRPGDTIARQAMAPADGFDLDNLLARERLSNACLRCSLYSKLHLPGRSDSSITKERRETKRPVVDTS